MLISQKIDKLIPFHPVYSFFSHFFSFQMTSKEKEGCAMKRRKVSQLEGPKAIQDCENRYKKKKILPTNPRRTKWRFFPTGN